MNNIYVFYIKFYNFEKINFNYLKRKIIKKYIKNFDKIKNII